MKRFWNKVKKTETCWEWTGAINADGYGNFNYQNKFYRVHRFSWYLTYGKFPKKWILHKCDNRRCVNPAHLYEGTPLENMEDMVRKGRDSNKGKLTIQEVREIKQKHIPYEYSPRKLAKEYGVSKNTVKSIIRNEIWKNCL